MINNITAMPNATKKLKLDQQQETGAEPSNLDRDSPIPLKNLGNTCYENSIIQCLFSLNMFMDNFERSMETMRKYVVQPKPKATISNFESDQPEQDHDQDQQSVEKTIEENDVRFRIANAFDNLYKSYTKKRTQTETQATETKNTELSKNSETGGRDYMTNFEPKTSVYNLNQVAIDPSITSSTQNIEATECMYYAQTSSREQKLQLTDIPATEAIDVAESKKKITDLTKNAPKPLSAPIITTSNSTPIALMSSSYTTATVSPNVVREQQSEIESRLEELKLAVGDRSSQFNSTHQQDASEFFYHVIDSIQEFYQSLNKTEDDDNPVTKAFELELDHLIKCPKCHHQTLTGPERIRTLPLALPHILVGESTTTPADPKTDSTSKSPELNHADVYNHATNCAPTPPTSDLGLDSPESSTYEEQQQKPQLDQSNATGVENRENQALNDNNHDVIREDQSRINSISKNTMSIAKLDLTDGSEGSTSSNQDSNKQEDELLTITSAQTHQSNLDIEQQEQYGPKLEEAQKTESVSQQNHTQKQYSLEDALNNYFKDELLECNCSQEGCDSKQRTKKCLIRKLPQVLFITLARYSYTGKKNLDEIEAPFELSVPFRENKSPSHSPATHSKFENDDCNKYQLVAVVSHHGSSLNAGHYTSYVYNQDNSSWYCCDDDSITKVRDADVKNDATKTGYCFFYAHNSCIAKRRSLSNTAQHEMMQSESITLLHEKGISENGVNLFSSSVAADSSVVLTPESSPSPSICIPELDPELIHLDGHVCCMNNDNVDDWS